VFGFWKVGALGAIFTVIAIWQMSRIAAMEEGA